MMELIASAQPRPCPETATLRSVNLTGPAGRLEALLNEGSPDAPFAALVCHPHPLFGGTMHNKVVYHAMKVLNDPAWGLCWPVLRFNFRGTGLSQGVHDGHAEDGDVLAALDWLENEYKRRFQFWRCHVSESVLRHRPGTFRPPRPCRAGLAHAG
jgi:alpha/beta superfamily hydrolase